MKTLYSFLLTILISISINTKSVYAQNNVLLEYCTGTWCGYCPCGHEIIENILVNYPNTIVLAYHGANSDPWNTYSEGIRSLIGLSSYPQATIGRKSGVISRSAWNNEVVLQSLLIQPGVSIEVTSKSYDAISRTLNANIKIIALTDLIGDYKINYVLTENNLIYPQNFYSDCGTPGYVNNYIHNHVVKSMINGDQGELINSGTWTSGQEIIRNINYVIPVSPQVDNPENCDLNIFVYKAGVSYSQTNHVQQALKVPIEKSVGISNQNITPAEYKLTQNYPNPFNPNTNFSFSIPRNEKVSLKIYDMLGNVVDTYVDGVLSAGTYSVVFDGANLSSGVYFYTLSAGSFVETKRMVLMK